MKTKNCKLIISSLFILILSLGATVKAMTDEPPAILSIFNKYSNHYGVTTFEASKELLEAYKITVFKSIYFQKIDVPMKEIKKCIDKDKAGASTIKENIKDGLIYSGYYKLIPKNSGINRYIIFKANNDATEGTLIFIEGKITPDELIELLK